MLFHYGLPQHIWNIVAEFLKMTDDHVWLNSSTLFHFELFELTASFRDGGSPLFVEPRPFLGKTMLEYVREFDREWYIGVKYYIEEE
jgi:hypothetical protein